jgi:hypothetical protein
VMNLDRQVCRRLRIVDVLSSHLAFTFCAPLDPVWAELRLIPLAILVPSNGMSWLVGREWSGLLVMCGWLG